MPTTARRVGRAALVFWVLLGTDVWAAQPDLRLVAAAKTQDAAAVRALLDERKALQAEVASLRRELAMSGGAAGPEAATEEVGGVPFVAQVLSGGTGKDLPPLIDEMKARLGSGVVLLIADTGGKAAVAAGVTADLTDRISAVDLVKAAVEALGGKGGGGRGRSNVRGNAAAGERRTKKLNNVRITLDSLFL